MKQQQSKLTTFLRTAAGGKGAQSSPAASPLRSSSLSPRQTTPQKKDEVGEVHDGAIPWPEIDLTTSPGASSSSATPSASGKRKPEVKSSTTTTTIELQLASPAKRLKKEEAAPLTPEPQPDSLEDVEEFSPDTKATNVGAARAPPTSAPSTQHPFFVRAGRGKRLGKEFYEHDCETLAKMLLGQVLVRVTHDGQRLAGRIVETEAYLGGEDKGAHSYGGKITKKNKSMFEPPGTAYIYRIYVTNFCFNVSSLGEGAAVLVRALEPVEGLARMRVNRLAGKASGTPVRDVDLTSGPGKSCQALELDLAQDGLDLITSDVLWIEEGRKIEERDVVAGPRVNIDYAEEWKDKPLRFYVKGNRHVSKPAFSNRGGKK